MNMDYKDYVVSERGDKIIFWIIMIMVLFFVLYLTGHLIWAVTR